MKADVIDLVAGVANRPPRSRLEADELEAALRELPEDPRLEDLSDALSCYVPTEDPGAVGLLGFTDLSRLARGVLHDLGDHRQCLHDLPLMERP